jgi:hypothetical protein
MESPGQQFPTANSDYCNPFVKRGRCEPGEWPSVDGQAQEDYRAEGYDRGGFFCYPSEEPRERGEMADNNMFDRRYGPDVPHNSFGYGNSGVQFAGYSAPWT